MKYELWYSEPECFGILLAEGDTASLKGSRARLLWTVEASTYQEAVQKRDAFLEGTDSTFVSLRDRDAQATEEQLRAASDKAHNAPLLLVAVACLGPRDPDTPAAERLVSLGAAIQNLLLGAQAKALVGAARQALAGLIGFGVAPTLVTAISGAQEVQIKPGATVIDVLLLAVSPPLSVTVSTAV